MILMPDYSRHMPPRVPRRLTPCVDMKREMQAEAARACREHGHVWEHYGGANAACDHCTDCYCSVPVYVCTRCGDMDYGKNQEARDIVAKCKKEHEDAEKREAVERERFRREGGMRGREDDGEELDIPFEDFDDHEIPF